MIGINDRDNFIAEIVYEIMEITEASGIRKQSFERRRPFRNTGSRIKYVNSARWADTHVVERVSIFPDTVIVLVHISLSHGEEVPRMNRHSQRTRLFREYARVHRGRCEQAMTSEVARPNRHRNWPVET